MSQHGPSSSPVLETNEVEAPLSEVLERKACDVVRYALFSEYRRQIIKRDDINKKILVENTRSFPVVFAAAQKRLRDIFGMELVELPAREKGTNATSQVSRRAAASKEKSQVKLGWVLCNVLDYNQGAGPGVLDWSNENRQMGITATVLSLIFLNNMSLTSDRLEYYLQKLDVQPPNMALEEKYPFATVLAPLVKTGYLERINLGHGDGQGSGGTHGGGNSAAASSGGGEAYSGTVEYRWGPRAKVEYPPRQMAGFIAEVD
ncbi:hypothetical protein H4R33_003905 [Dimargaris cristalligena]|uniref:MAGE family-domain-containing protein n=1 Tax=Dimargaris cristalligena TaxID=215637 RepID=A0A4P9ZUG5_9FUNG|nr:hypothetical protein H4R33_003905 [Dimargaris cristalligena]RKP36888.1 MAGE family-domain-containing protein [Dimargaris cristalligena]|eukprot:RKP36888.1 MAGE family-domain-containing protein [Dimargaris cristalligena]